MYIQKNLIHETQRKGVVISNVTCTLNVPDTLLNIFTNIYVITVFIPILYMRKLRCGSAL